MVGSVLLRKHKNVDLQGEGTTLYRKELTGNSLKHIYFISVETWPTGYMCSLNDTGKARTFFRRWRQRLWSPRGQTSVLRLEAKFPGWGLNLDEVMVGVQGRGMCGTELWFCNAKNALFNLSGRETSLISIIIIPLPRTPHITLQESQWSRTMKQSLRGMLRDHLLHSPGSFPELFIIPLLIVFARDGYQGENPWVNLSMSKFLQTPSCQHTRDTRTRQLELWG